MRCSRFVGTATPSNHVVSFFTAIGLSGIFCEATNGANSLRHTRAVPDKRCALLDGLPEGHNLFL